MKKSEVFVGQRIGRLEVIGEPYVTGHHLYVPVICDCGTKKAVSISNLGSNTTSCGCLKVELSKARKGALAGRWKGGRTVLAGGYIGIWEPDHPNAEKIGYVREHIKVMTEKLGRPLLPHEEVHHKNTIKDDNSPENLELWSTSQPHGGRVEDKTVWAKEWLAVYDPSALAQR
jgi:hypothetical protein